MADMDVLQPIAEFLRAYPIVAVIGGIVILLLIVNLAKTLLQGAIATAIVVVCYAIFLMVTDQPPPDLKQLQKDGRNAAQETKDKGRQQLERVLEQELTEEIQEKLE